MITATTRYVGPTERQGARIIVTVRDNGARMQRTVPYNHSTMSPGTAHEVAVAAVLGVEPYQVVSTGQRGRSLRHRVY